jgi:flavin reductase (DIM6/NTAB) family NADH-FMN oxidoreductase RutF
LKKEGGEGAQKEALKRLPSGVYVIGSVDGDGVRGIIATWVTQISFKPRRVAVALQVGSRMEACVRQSQFFSVNLLPAGGTALAKAFLKGPRSTEGKLNGVLYDVSEGGAPILREAAAAVVCRVDAEYPGGDHTLFVGLAVDAVSRGDSGILTLNDTGWHYSR